MRYPYAEIPADIAANIAARGGTPFNLYKVLANAPAMLGAWIDFAWTLRADCGTPRDLRELMILRTAQMQVSAYEWHQHRIMARAAGVTEEQVAELAMWSSSALFDAKQRAALALTEAIVHGDVGDAVHAELSKHFNREECLELTITAAFYCMVARVLSAIAVTADGE
jgi:AhpD family alkylhydroperoxidase